jgi:hypothetical protein
MCHGSIRSGPQAAVAGMKYALISDIHANLPALEAVLDHIGRESGVAATYHLGDLVGYAPWPNETVALLQAQGTDYKHCGCRYEDPKQEELSHLSYGWTRQHVSPSTKSFLAGLPSASTCCRTEGTHPALAPPWFTARLH